MARVTSLGTTTSQPHQPSFNTYFPIAFVCDILSLGVFCRAVVITLTVVVDTILALWMGVRTIDAIWSDVRVTSVGPYDMNTLLIVVHQILHVLKNNYVHKVDFN